MTTNITIFKRMGNILSLVFCDYYEARVFRSSFMRLVTYAVLFIIGYRLNLVFDNVPGGRIFDGYAMAALFCGFSVLVSMVIGIIALPISVAYNLYNIAKAGAALGKRSFFCQNGGL